MNNPFDYIPDAECNEAFASLIDRIESLKKSNSPDDINFCRELEAGKMLGVLIAVDSSGERHTLYAFSGQLGDGEFHHPWFVGPVFDYLQPDGYFKTKEREISRQTREVVLYEENTLLPVKSDYMGAREIIDAEISRIKEKCRLSKLERDAKRKSGILGEYGLAALTRQSQFEKAELHRLKKRLAADLEPYALRLHDAQSRLNSLKEKRRLDSENLQQWLFSNFRLLNSRGESKSLGEIFAETPFKIPPSGAGECCAPKLLQAAYSRGWKPVSIAEYWYGKPKDGEVRIHGEHYPACRGKCLPVLTWMLQGLDIEPPLNSDRQSSIKHVPRIIFENKWFCVVDKPSGMLSVPGKGESQSLEEWLTEKYGQDKCVKMAHRLDQDTSGLVVATFGELSFKVMQTLFAFRMVKKTYVADLEGDYESMGIPQQGRINLPMSPDYLDRPRQRVDYKNGKDAVTDYEFLGKTKDWSRVLFHPRTGRTHQLRVHASSESGLGMPIVGDRLYGKNKGHILNRLLRHNRIPNYGRLHLHAHKLEFTFPIDKRHYSLESPVPF